MFHSILEFYRVVPISNLITTSLLHPIILIFRQADLDKDGLITNWEFYLTLDPNDEGKTNFFPHSLTYTYF